MDIEGTFDNVSFTAIDKAIERRNLHNIPRRWIRNYLSSRNICYEAYSRRTEVKAKKGSPQGGVLSPTLWIMVMDNLLKKLQSAKFHVIGYADDLGVICRGKFLGTICERTQAALKIVETWCIETGLGVNPSKTELVVFTNKLRFDNFKPPILFGTKLERKDTVKYLGDTFNRRLNWSDH